MNEFVIPVHIDILKPYPVGKCQDLNEHGWQDHVTNQRTGIQTGL